jgi:cytochrome c-type protein NapB
MPHPMHMRSECDSCHGPSGRPGLRTSHPDRQNCVQCHASSAPLDQRGMSVDIPPAGGGAP